MSDVAWLCLLASFGKKSNLIKKIINNLFVSLNSEQGYQMAILFAFKAYNFSYCKYARKCFFARVQKNNNNQII